MSTNELLSMPRHRMRKVAAVAFASVAAIAILAGTGSHLVQSQEPTPANANLGNIVKDEGYADLVAAVSPAVVNVKVERTERAGGMAGPMADPEMRRFFERFFGQPMPESGPQERPVQGEGSGFVIDPDGIIVTNAHVAGDADTITVVLQDGSEHEATLKGVDAKTDLAVLKIEAGQPLPYVVFGDSDQVRVGDKVIAVGNPFGLGGTVTSGIVSATNREIGSGPYDDFLQVDAPINRGNSGGPTFNLDGEVVGVNSAIFSPSGGSVGIGFAISSNLAKEIVADLVDDGKVERGWLGVQIQGLDEDLAASLGLAQPEGALVSRVEPNSPAEAAGVQRGDVILAFGDQRIDRVTALSRVVAATDAGSERRITVWRDGREQMLETTVARMPSEQQMAAGPGREESAGQPRLGLSLAPLTAEARAQLGLDTGVKGVVVAQVTPDGPAAAKGIQAGDVIVSVDRHPVTQPQEVIEAVQAAEQEGKRAVLMLVLRDGQELFQAIPFATS